MSGKRKRRVMIVEYDVSQMSQSQVDALLLRALRAAPDVSFQLVEHSTGASSGR